MMYKTLLAAFFGLFMATTMVGCGTITTGDEAAAELKQMQEEYEAEKRRKASQ